MLGILQRVVRRGHWRRLLLDNELRISIGGVFAKLSVVNFAKHGDELHVRVREGPDFVRSSAQRFVELPRTFATKKPF